MFDNLSRQNRRKMILNAFVYYPLGFIVGISTGIAVLKYISGGFPSVGLIIVTGIFLLLIAINHLKQIYKGLLNEDGSK